MGAPLLGLPRSIYYVVRALLRNALTCFYGNSTSSFFDYFAWLPSENGKNRDHSGTL